MRITKKFAGSSCIGKQSFVPCENTPENEIRISEVQAELNELQSKFIEKLITEKSLARSAMAAPPPLVNPDMNYSGVGYDPNIQSMDMSTANINLHNNINMAGNPYLSPAFNPHIRGVMGLQHLADSNTSNSGGGTTFHPQYGYIPLTSLPSNPLPPSNNAGMYPPLGMNSMTGNGNTNSMPDMQIQMQLAGTMSSNTGALNNAIAIANGNANATKTNNSTTNNSSTTAFQPDSSLSLRDSSSRLSDQDATTSTSEKKRESSEDGSTESRGSGNNNSSGEENVSQSNSSASSQRSPRGSVQSGTSSRFSGPTDKEHSVTGGSNGSGSIQHSGSDPEKDGNENNEDELVHFDNMPKANQNTSVRQRSPSSSSSSGNDNTTSVNDKNGNVKNENDSTNNLNNNLHHMSMPSSQQTPSYDNPHLREYPYPQQISHLQQQQYHQHLMQMHAQAQYQEHFSRSNSHDSKKKGSISYPYNMNMSTMGMYYEPMYPNGNGGKGHTNQLGEKMPISAEELQRLQYQRSYQQQYMLMNSMPANLGNMTMNDPIHRELPYSLSQAMMPANNEHMTSSYDHITSTNKSKSKSRKKRTANDISGHDRNNNTGSSDEKGQYFLNEDSLAQMNDMTKHYYHNDRFARSDQLHTQHAMHELQQADNQQADEMNAYGRRPNEVMNGFSRNQFKMLLERHKNEVKMKGGHADLANGADLLLNFFKNVTNTDSPTTIAENVSGVKDSTPVNATDIASTMKVKANSSEKHSTEDASEAIEKHDSTAPKLETKTKRISQRSDRFPRHKQGSESASKKEDIEIAPHTDDTMLVEVEVNDSGSSGSGGGRGDDENGDSEDSDPPSSSGYEANMTSNTSDPSDGMASLNSTDSGHDRSSSEEKE